MHLRLLFEIVLAEINPVGYSFYGIKIHSIMHRSYSCLPRIGQKLRRSWEGLADEDGWPVRFGRMSSF